MRRFRRALRPIGLFLLGVIALPTGSALGQKGSHIPTEEELHKQLTGVKSDDEREYQQRSVEVTQSWLHQALDWVRDLLRQIHLTPARFMLILGGIGAIYTAGKNKRKVEWAVLTAFSYLLVIAGLGAMIFDWPYMN